MHWHCI
jgi:hypothetical protein